ncbi:hypothetical protein WH43_00020 [Rheinheimera sp. KL1]|uniref:RHS repeat domain-containing protein n=1 Tax=Rheinheimera sp. KL1 TaxID=1635005 RepID=UPI0006A99E5D|nr:hypothetical protein WH43_00020 [Rheinheimera sp. KL1]
MNGRAYDYNLGRFLSVDPVIQSPGNSQSLNPYSYIMNNPLAGTDPTGYHIKVVLLTSLYKKGYDFDVRLLYPLSDRNSAIYNEPVPQLAVKVIHKHYADSTSDLLNYYKDDPLNRKLIENQLQKLK